MGVARGDGWGAGGAGYGVVGVRAGAQAISALAPYPFSAITAFWFAGPMFPASLVLTGVGLLLARNVPRWVGALVCLGGPVFPVGQILRVELVASGVDMMLLVPFAYLAWRMVSDEWTAPVLPWQTRERVPR